MHLVSNEGPWVVVQIVTKQEVMNVYPRDQAHEWLYSITSMRVRVEKVA